MRGALRFAAASGLLALAMLAMPAAALGPQALLEPQEAFRLTLAAVDAKSALIEFRILDGYYRYRDRFRFETSDGRVIAEAELPPGRMKQDPFFGRTEIYRDRVTIRVPVGGAERARGSVRLKVVSQGCADSGVCYIPQEQWVEVGLRARTERINR